MAGLYKCFASTSIVFFIFFTCVLSLIFSSHVVNASELSEGNTKSQMSNTDTPDKQLLKTTRVYPIHGLTTGPPLTVLEEQNTTNKSDIANRAQRSQPEDAQELEYNSENTTNIRNLNDTETEGEERLESASNLNYTETEGEERLESASNLNDTETEGEERLESAISQRLLDDPVTTTVPLIGNCTSEGSVDHSDNPAKDTVKLYEIALGNILEHVTGVDQNINDPEEIRMRAYVGERQSFGVQVILEEETHFWESSLEGDAVDPIENVEDYTSLNTSSFTLRQEQYVEDEAINEQDTQITVKEGSRLRLVCNVTGVPTYFVEWRRAANLSFPGGASVVGGRSVLLDYVGREDAGIYSCTATTPSGHSHSSAVGIHVHYAPIVGVWARDMDTNKVELGCLVEGRPRPSSAWYMNITRISPSYCPGNVEIRSSVLSSRFVLSVLSISNVTIDDFAYYHCRATNPVGVSRAYIMLHDESGFLDLQVLADMRPVKHPAPLENPRLSSFMLGMVPPLYIGCYIIAYLGCYKTSISGVGGHGRFGGGIEIDMNE